MVRSPAVTKLPHAPPLAWLPVADTVAGAVSVAAAPRRTRCLRAGCMGACMHVIMHCVAGCASCAAKPRHRVIACLGMAPCKRAVQANRANPTSVACSLLWTGAVWCGRAGSGGFGVRWQSTHAGLCGHLLRTCVFPAPRLISHNPCPKTPVPWGCRRCTQRRSRAGGSCTAPAAAGGLASSGAGLLCVCGGPVVGSPRPGSGSGYNVTSRKFWQRLS